MSTTVSTVEHKLRDFFFENASGTPSHPQKRRLEQGVFITSRDRSTILTSPNQGKIIINGTVRRYAFENCGGGVYRMYLQEI